jgi:cyanate lyase
VTRDEVTAAIVAARLERTLKELIHEQFGDGIMSAINFSIDVSRKELDGAARVVVTFDGKFLPYDWTAGA